MTELHRAYAKMNLGLRILGKRPDAYHSIETVFHRIDLFDQITFSSSPSIIVESNSSEAPGGEENICYKAATLLQKFLGTGEGVHISITKNIPVGAGLGGGSSDAATTLRELPRFWKKSVQEETLQEMALQLGSDVPFFLGRSSALGRGRGEVLEYFDLEIPYWIVLCYPNIHVSTARAYSRISPAHPSHQNNLRQTLELNIQQPDVLTKELKNDFEEIVFEEYPEVGSVKKTILESGAIFASMSGSGSSVYGFFQEEKSAANVMQQLNSKGYRTFLTAPGFKL